jgi:hypothetical protein
LGALEIRDEKDLLPVNFPCLTDTLPFADGLAEGDCVDVSVGFWADFSV